MENCATEILVVWNVRNYRTHDNFQTIAYSNYKLPLHIDITYWHCMLTLHIDIIRTDVPILKNIYEIIFLLLWSSAK